MWFMRRNSRMMELLLSCCEEEGRKCFVRYVKKEKMVCFNDDGTKLLNG